MTLGEQQKLESELLATGALWGCLVIAQDGGATLKVKPVVDEKGMSTNKIDVMFAVLASKYRITVEQTPGPW